MKGTVFELNLYPKIESVLWFLRFLPLFHFQESENHTKSQHKSLIWETLREKPSALQMDSSLLVVAAGKRLEFLDSQRRCRIGTFNLKSRSGELSRASPVDSSSSLNYVNSSTGMKVMDYEILSLCFDDTNLVTAGARGFFTLYGSFFFFFFAITKI